MVWLDYSNHTVFYYKSKIYSNEDTITKKVRHIVYAYGGNIFDGMCSD